jgi:hypothetical protein
MGIMASGGGHVFPFFGSGICFNQRMITEVRGLSLVLAATLLFSWRFKSAQDRNTANRKWVGGEISWPKALWLAYALGSWFFVPWVFALSASTAEPFRWVLYLHLASWWIRGPLELVMIYRWFNWTPVYGISHDAFHNVALFVATSVAASFIGWEQLSADPFNLCVLAYLGSICFAMMAEVTFASLFIATRTPADGLEEHEVYFASDDSRYRLINRLTVAAVVIVYAHWVAQVLFLGFLPDAKSF